MGMTVTEKILAKAAGLTACTPGEIVEAKIDVAMLHDVGTPGLQEPLARLGASQLDPTVQVVVIPDHFTPAPSIAAAENLKTTREFANQHSITNYYELGRAGICHQVMAEAGFVRPGRVVIGTDSHTTTLGALSTFAAGVGFTDMAVALTAGHLWFKVPATVHVEVNGQLGPGVTAKDLALYCLQQFGPERFIYKAMEFGGGTIGRLSIDGRMCLCNMAAEMGVKNCFIDFDDKVGSYLSSRVDSTLVPMRSDGDAAYAELHELDVSTLEPLLAYPPSPFDVRPVREAAGIRIDQAFVGSCTNGRLEDLQSVAKVLSGRKIHPAVRMIITPASQRIYHQALKEGLLEVFVDAGAVVTHSTCGGCVGGHLGVLAAGEVCIASSNRNFRGRMGSPKAQIYLASPATVAAAAVRGQISDPREFLDS